ncbi:S-adenosylmethionine decarboxylase proenzyme 2 [Frankliniella fusca]|uniref:S-adenosylmethionine decarboxylase proenzyme 2 n=1 Tax=Frankliniella fusca TaxID=407009 RepID=A0AAE1HHA5_9NEOP|nr:S-adenosylmethionine decarboxylase proenzyme 2 [Frankliniella fusca]
MSPSQGDLRKYNNHPLKCSQILLEATSECFVVRAAYCNINSTMLKETSCGSDTYPGLSISILLMYSKMISLQVLSNFLLLNSIPSLSLLYEELQLDVNQVQKYCMKLNCEFEGMVYIQPDHQVSKDGLVRKQSYSLKPVILDVL